METWWVLLRHIFHGGSGGFQVHSHSGLWACPNGEADPRGAAVQPSSHTGREPSHGRSVRACLAALSWSRLLRARIPEVLTPLSSCRRFTRSALPWKRSWSSFVLSPSCDFPHGCARAGAEQCPAALQGEEFRAAEQGLCQGSGEDWSWLGLSLPHYTHFAFAGEEGTENKYLTVGYFWVGDALPSFLPLHSLMCKCSLSLKWITWEYFIYVKNSWFICILATPPALIIKRYSIPEFLLKLKTHTLRCASGCYWFL